jgi:hypothetical protein
VKAKLAKVDKWVVTTPLGRVVKGFFFTLVMLAVADWTQSGQISFNHWTTWLLVAAGPILSMGYDYASKNFPLFGPALDAVVAQPNVPVIVKQAAAEAKAPRAKKAVAPVKKVVAKKATKSIN